MVEPNPLDGRPRPPTIKCPLCGAPTLEPFLERPAVPMQQNVLARTAQEARGLPRAELSMAACGRCGFVCNRSFRGVEYASGYDNAQSFSEAFENHEATLVREVALRSRGKSIVEVGSGDGRFLRRLIEAAGPTTTGLGFDPAYAGDLGDPSGAIRFERCYFEPSRVPVPADVVVCRHVIEHVPDPVAFLQDIRHILADSPTTALFFETPCVDWILERGVVWDVFYEHCSLFNARSLRTAFEASGFAVANVRHVFGGQYLWLEAWVEEAPSHPHFDCGNVPTQARLFGKAELRLRERWQSFAMNLAANHEVALWGAGAKGVTFANLVDPDARLLRCVADMNPNKQGGYLPGTGHAIVDPATLGRRGVDRALVLNPNYGPEIQAFVKSHGMNLEVLDLMELQR